MGIPLGRSAWWKKEENRVMMGIEKSRQCVGHDLHALVLIIWRRSQDFEEEFTQDLPRAISGGILPRPAQRLQGIPEMEQRQTGCVFGEFPG